ncbi:MAG: response regulator [Cytobacillus gottheilii]|uniref:response regulator transcription factor n=1 Tax=Cytobacillus gottheilii TaxID=859144 RepID=UPI00082B7C89|nr:response regulator [Cytobacillus gottheilii]
MFKVVIADDESLILKNLKIIIPWRELDCEVIGTAKNGTEAYALCKEKEADILLTDISMPGMTGIDLLKQLAALPKSPLTIMISGYDYFEYAKEAIKHNAFDYILKPVDYEELEGCIRRGVIHLKNQIDREYRVFKQHLYEAFTSESAPSVILDPFPSLIPVVVEREGGVLDIPPFEDHTYCYSLSNTMMVVLVEWPSNDLSLLKRTWEDWDENQHKVLIGGFIHSEIELNEEIKELQNWLAVQRLTEERVQILKEFREEQYSKKTVVDTIEEAISYIKEQYNKDISAEQTAAQVQMSVSYFSSHFKQVTGVTFLEYLTSYRIEKACFLLENTDLKTYQIAEKVGYTDSRYFSQVFRKRVKVTPSEYRKK